LEYKLKKASEEDFLLSYEIRKNSLGKYVEETWGWDEEWQMKYHKEDFNIDILQIIEVEGKPAGTLESYEEDGTIRVSGIYIIDEFQGKGIGCDIMQKIIDEAGSKDMQIQFQVLKVNVRAKKFYERLGFSVYGENQTHYQMIYKPKIVKW
jgi:ribosomal protein S18 acetylase RimI-like enzyme